MSLLDNSRTTTCTRSLHAVAFSQSYLSNGGACGTVVVCLSVVVICNECIVAKRCEIRLRLLLITNKKSHWLSNDIKIIDLEWP